MTSKNTLTLLLVDSFQKGLLQFVISLFYKCNENIFLPQKTIYTFFVSKCNM